MHRHVRTALVAFAIGAAAIAVAASGDSNTATKVGGGSDSGSSNSAQTYKVGDEVKLGDWTVKVYGVTDPAQPESEFETVAPGTRWVALDTEVKNLSSSPQAVSSLACFELQDSENKTYTEELASVGAQAPDGEVAPNGAKRGNIVFAVPTAATGLKLNFKCDLLSSGSATIQIS
jgi:hypothetical protein